MNRRNWSLWAVMAAGYAFLYVPILSLAVYSFSASRIATVWGGFSTRWYAALFANEQIMQALGRSLAIAALSATLATVLGTASGLALSRFGRFPGRGLLSLMNSAPMVPQYVSNKALRRSRRLINSFPKNVLLMLNTVSWSASENS